MFVFAIFRFFNLVADCFNISLCAESLFNFYFRLLFFILLHFTIYFVFIFNLSFLILDFSINFKYLLAINFSYCFDYFEFKCNYFTKKFTHQ